MRRWYDKCCLHNTTVWLCLMRLCSETFCKRQKQKRGIRILCKKIRRFRMAIKYGRRFMGFNREWKSLPSTFTVTVFITAYGKRSRKRHIPMGMITPDCFGNLIVLTTFNRKIKYDILSVAQGMIDVSKWQFKKWHSYRNEPIILKWLWPSFRKLRRFYWTK